MAQAWRSQENLQELVCPTLWVLGVKLRSPSWRHPGPSHQPNPFTLIGSGQRHEELSCKIFSECNVCVGCAEYGTVFSAVQCQKTLGVNFPPCKSKHVPCCPNASERASSENIQARGCAVPALGALDTQCISLGTYSLLQKRKGKRPERGGGEDEDTLCFSC